MFWNFFKGIFQIWMSLVFRETSKEKFCVYLIYTVEVFTCEYKTSDGFISRKLEELLNLMIEVMPCHFVAKRHRLDCLYFLIEHVSKDNLEERRHGVIASFLTEIMLALKELDNDL